MYVQAVTKTCLQVPRTLPLFPLSKTAHIYIYRYPTTIYVPRIFLAYFLDVVTVRNMTSVVFLNHWSIILLIHATTILSGAHYALLCITLELQTSP